MAAKDYRSALGAFFEEKPRRGVISAYLFGSRGAGGGHRESDVDIGILLDRRIFSTTRNRFQERIELSTALIGAIHDNSIDVVIKNDSTPVFARRIVIEGRRVFSADSEADRVFVRDIQLRAADLEPFLERHRRKALATIVR